MTSDVLMKALQEGTCSLCYRPVELCCALRFHPQISVLSVIPKATRSAVQLRVAVSVFLILVYFRGGTLCLYKFNLPWY